MICNQGLATEERSITTEQFYKTKRPSTQIHFVYSAVVDGSTFYSYFFPGLR